MPRTFRQNARRKVITFRSHCVEYAEGKRQRPPRIKFGTTIPTWEMIAQSLGVDPAEVYDDHREYHIAERNARSLNITVDEALSRLWEKHCARLVLEKQKNERAFLMDKRKRIKAEALLPDPIRNDVTAARLARILLTKARSKGKPPESPGK